MCFSDRSVVAGVLSKRFKRQDTVVPVNGRAKPSIINLKLNFLWCFLGLKIP